MSNTRFAFAIAFTAVVTGTLVAGLTLSRTARAGGGDPSAKPQPPHTAECMAPSTLFDLTAGQMKPATAESTAAWMTTEYQAGREHFVVTPSSGAGGSGFLCAW